MKVSKWKCHKEVHASDAIITRGEYNILRGWTLPADESPNDPGYVVVYSKGNPDEYMSWSPAHSFEEGYTMIEEEL